MVLRTRTFSTEVEEEKNEVCRVCDASLKTGGRVIMTTMSGEPLFTFCSIECNSFWKNVSGENY